MKEKTKMPAYNDTTVEIYEIPDFNKQPEGIPWALDSMTCAHHLGIRNRTNTNLVNERDTLYQESFIPKKSGGKRSIHAPSSVLKFVQRRVLKRYFDPIPYPEHITAYVRKLSTRNAVSKHAGKPLLIVLDLQDFFTTTRRTWVRKALKEEFGLPQNIAEILSDLTTVKMRFPYGERYRVPQGAPTSGAVCNWVAYNRIDRPIIKLCEKYDMYYTRYADDLAFSCAKRLGKAETNKFIREISAIIETGGYRVNRSKTRVTRAGRQQRLLGMTINEKPNIMRYHYRKLRAQINNCKWRGFEEVAKATGLENGVRLRSRIEGTLSYYWMINPEKTTKLKIKYKEALECQNITPPAYLQDQNQEEPGATT